MKHNIIFLAAILAASLSSCTKNNTRQSFEPSSPARLTVSLGRAATKATVPDTADEAKVNTLTVFVFNGESVDGYGTISSQSSLELSATTGARDIYAVVNAGGLSTISSKTELLQTISRLSDNASDSFVMVGSKNATLSATGTVTIDVSRLVARIRISKITRNITDVPSVAALPSEDFKISRIYLCDAVGNVRMGGGSASPVLWLSSRLAASAAIETTNPFLYCSLGAGAQLSQNGYYDTPQCFYCYPNAASTDSESARITRLVVECIIDGTVYTYPIPIGVIESNKSYQIDNLIITRLGNPSDGDDDIEDGEDSQIQSGSVTFEIQVRDWEQVLVTGPGDNAGEYTI